MINEFTDNNSMDKIEELMRELDHAWMTIVDSKIDSDVNEIHKSVHDLKKIVVISI